jgi:hypothetical protein
LFGPFTCDPGTAEEPAPLGWDWDAAFDPVAPVDAAPEPLLAPAAPALPPALPPLLPPLWAKAKPPDRARDCNTDAETLHRRSP